MSATHPHVPETIGNYVIEHALAHGSMGTVYVAHHSLTYARVALKVMRSEANVDKQAEERFLREVRAAARIGHDGIVKVQDAGKTPEGHLYLAMELLTGETLEERIAHGTGERLTGMDWLLAMLEPLTAAHAHSIVHRDLKPANVFIARATDGSEHIKLLDFGLARDTREKSGTQTGIALGTPYYMSPEQAARPKDVSPASDVWSVGVMMYELLTGHMPFEGETLHAVVIAAATTEHIPACERAPSLDPELGALVDACLSKDPARRPRDATELRDRLLPLLEEPTVRAELANALPRAAGLGDGDDTPIEPTRMPFADTAIALAHDSRIQDVHPRTKSSGLGIWISTFAVLALVIAGFFWALERNSDRNTVTQQAADSAKPSVEPSLKLDPPPEPEPRPRTDSRAVRESHEITPSEPAPEESVVQDPQPAGAIGSRREAGRNRNLAKRGAPASLQALPNAEFYPDPEPSPSAEGSPSTPTEAAHAEAAPDPKPEIKPEAAAPSGEAPTVTSEAAPQTAPSAPAAEAAPPSAAAPEPAPATAPGSP
jgi:serine/threonine-protein kinase